jgi:hypothetical protein
MRDPHPPRPIHHFELCIAVPLHAEHEVGEFGIVEIRHPSPQVMLIYPAVMTQRLFKRFRHLFAPQRPSIKKARR